MTGTVKEIIAAKRQAGEGAYLYLRFNLLAELYESEEGYTSGRPGIKSWELDDIEHEQLVETGLIDKVGVLGCTGNSHQETVEAICRQMLEENDPLDPTLFDRMVAQFEAAGVCIDHDSTERARDESPNIIAIYREEDSDEGLDYIEILDGEPICWGYNGKIDADLMTVEQIRLHYFDPDITAEDLAGLRFIQWGDGTRLYDGADIDSISIRKTEALKAQREALRTLTLTLPDEFLLLCQSVNETPESILSSFIADLCSLDGPAPYITSGSDERMFADEWFDRCGYRWRAEDLKKERRS